MRSHEVDTIIYGTGFKADEYLSTVDVVGEGGRHLSDDWAEGAEAYMGISVAGYPNFFLLYGPNTNGVTSIIFLLRGAGALRDGGAASHAPVGPGQPGRPPTGDGPLQPPRPVADGGNGVDGGVYELLPRPRRARW